MENEVLNSKNFWNKIHENYDRENILSDNWLDQFEDIINSCEENVLDLGCGSGNDTKIFISKGKNVVCADQSENAIKNIEKNFPEVVEAKCFNMLDEFPFEDNSFGIVCADLSLHYFREEDTKRILKEIKRILIPEGHLFVRVNTIKDVNHGAGEGVLIEPHVYITGDGMVKRFFDEEDIKRVFSEYGIIFLEEQKMLRYKAEKIVYVVGMKNELHTSY